MASVDRNDRDLAAMLRTAHQLGPEAGEVFTKILVAYDRSPHARAALGHAVDIARTQQAELTVLTSYSTGLAWPGVGLGGLDQTLYDQIVEAARAEGQAAIDDAVQQLPEGMMAATRLVHAPAAEAILAEAGQGGYDLIVVGSRGRGDAGSMFLGSVSHRVVHSCHLPVLVVTSRRDAEPAA
jgi:nucleotide-binding universal stress UspA family protein